MAMTQTVLQTFKWTARYMVVPLIVTCALLSLLPLIKTDTWWVRYLGFVPVQLLIALVILILLYSVLGRLGGILDVMTLGLACLAIGYNFYKIHPYIPLLQEDAIAIVGCPVGSKVRILVANVQKTNEQAQELLGIVRSTDPDLFLALETDQWWDERLAQLSNQFPNRVQHIPQGHAFFGMHLFSKYELINPEVRFLFDNFTPSIFTDVRLPDGSAVSFFGLHPQPPHSWSQPTTMRDAHLLTVALQARDTQAPSILAGDFNAVPWERVTRQVMRIGKLLDPRVGRGLYPTYHAQSIFLSWPLDQILYQNKLALLAFERLSAFG
jgi:endonuclease/exonuclease/phosphatase (EEP) superfamily protein YafD